jgi:chromosome segregation ATPase
MTTRRQLKCAIVRQAISVSAAEDQAEFLQRKLAGARSRNVEIRREKAALFAENHYLRADLDEHVSLIHRLCDARTNRHDELRIVRKLSSLYQAQSLEFCAKYEAEEKRANDFEADMRIARAYSKSLMRKNSALRSELSACHTATESDLRKIEGLRDSLAKAIRKLHAVRFDKKAKAKR